MDQDIEEESLDKEVCLTGCDHKLHKELIHVDKIKKRYCFTDKGTRCKSWVDYRDYHKEREFMFNWLHPKQKEAKEEKKNYPPVVVGNLRSTKKKPVIS